ncbi:hypothetical protein R1sor_007108 [Riccia sorocarpa]|uniref:ABC transporter domain-containing protein n=1 Tax=Riccia sorocarpa TaxID=122646 RepID=A0ABD3HSD6_9MARC
MGLRLRILLGFILVLGSSSFFMFKQVNAQDVPRSPPKSSLPPQVGIFNDPPPDPTSLLPKSVMDKLTKSVDDITTQVANNYSFCIKNAQADRENTFDINRNPGFLTNCALQLGVSFIDRVCKKSEIVFYFQQIRTIKFPGAPPNSNCNHESWTAACEPGWSGVLDANVSDSAPVDVIPMRVADPQPCCPGFFCPRGLTCMMPCPLGAYCPMATFNETTASCEPYGYQLSPKSNVSCGSADLWLTFGDSEGMYCEAGSFCPSTTNKTTCSSDHYCRAGSTSQSKCSLLSQCGGEGTESQNLKVSGILLLVIIFVFLLVVYNCSEQLLHIRQRRKNRDREIAAREARDRLTSRVTAAERWRLAAVKALKTRTMSWKRTWSTREGSEPGPIAEPPTKAHHKPTKSSPFPQLQVTPIKGDQDSEEQDFYLLKRSKTDMVHYPTAWSDDQITAEPPANASVTQGDLYDIAVDEEAANAVQDYEVKSESTKPSQMRHTRTQAYKYAYGQIEMERQSLEMKDLGDVVGSHGFRNMMEGSGRFRIELSFLDLSLFLKGSGKRILSHVSGKFSPCRVTAVMGPSGAGKTTFLNALAGKYTGSRIEGHVLINGQPGSIQSYKKIIGFVPQDDIVHGSLTVEENLWFSAKYRLPMGLAKPDRVLIVERIINTLGLSHIRDSLVGTVEKRGISGGQRKRVNVAMELVIEPSLLILDEPTSGLDSTSSRLVLQALRREALWGVNVAVVLHQPSYGLFRMFDDVMFLAKGGWTVYLGPVDEVESYFAALGFKVPDRINPPDYFMDVLEGVEKHQTDEDFDITTLPTMWMCQKGYRIPPELESPPPNPLHATRSGRIAALRKTFSQDVFDDFRAHLLMAWDSFATSFSRVKDLSGRRTPGFFRQYRLIVRRVAKQRFREPRLFAQDNIILLLAGICMGVTADWTDSNLGAKGYTYTIIAISLLVMIASLRTFQMDKINFWRESASGINRLSFFLAKDTVDHFSTVIRPLVYLSMFYFFNDPRSSFAANYVITLGLVYCVTGISYILAILMNPAPAQLSSVFVPVVATLVVIGSRSGIMSKIANLSFAEWALEAFVITNAERYTGVWLITRCGVMANKGYRIGDKYYCVAVLFIYGVAARIVALACLFLCNRNRQK